MKINKSRYKIIGLTSDVSGNHNSSTVYCTDGEIRYAKRGITRKNHDRVFLTDALKEILRRQKLRFNGFGYFVFGIARLNTIRI